MTKPVGSLGAHDAADAFSATDTLLDLQPVLVAKLTGVRHNWGVETWYRAAGHGFFNGPMWARREADRIRERGMGWRVSEVPALRLDTAERSLVLVCAHGKYPFETHEDSPSRGKLRVGLAVSAAIRMLSEVKYAFQGEQHGVTILDIARGISLPPAQAACETWTSWPARPQLEWFRKHDGESDYDPAGAVTAAVLFAEQSGERALAESRALLRELGATESSERPKLSVVSRL